ncbi:Longitudinals lacking protein, isoforms A/B/D/L [Zootermopsis nevadensis]|uniref:Longitudinals lacking protein, isoforms A/B/D/L n=1 Tax=Zootermopsis nevadensis TaxID=136037 RepID=A0A067RD58_ZOONE|nr:Longitudinals lacking protein, isoforms A/B/D/L [Zootermopsis nevadensis]
MTHGEVVTGFSPRADFKVNVTEIKSHLKVHKEKRTHIQVCGIFPCDRCGKLYVHKNSLQRHMKWECGKEPIFQCPFCPQLCKRKEHRIRHIRRQHSDMIDYIDMDVFPGITEAMNE